MGSKAAGAAASTGFGWIGARGTHVRHEGQLAHDLLGHAQSCSHSTATAHAPALTHRGDVGHGGQFVQDLHGREVRQLQERGHGGRVKVALVQHKARVRHERLRLQL